MKIMPKKTTISLVVATISAATLVNERFEANAFTDQRVTNLLQTGANDSISNDYIYLTDLNWIEDQSSVAWGAIKKNENYSNGLITLQLNGETVAFTKGIAAHATSTVVFDVSQYSQQYSRFTTYVGVDKSQGNNGDGVRFTISTSMDGQNWTELAQTDLLKGNQDAKFIDVDITGAKYLKLYAHDNYWNESDHAVYGSPRLVTADYDPSTEIIGGLKSVAQYDEEIKLKYSENQELTEELKHLLLQRVFTQRIGFYTLQNIASTEDKYLETIQWILNNKEILELYIMGGELENGATYTNSLNVLTELYTRYKEDFKDSQNGNLYLKMAISLSLTHAKEIKFWTGNSEASNACERYRIYKENYNNGKMEVGGDKELFKSLPVELMRWVIDSEIDDEQINWLVDYALKTKAEGRDYLDAYTYINYTFDYNYNNEKFYRSENYDKWNEKYNISNLTGYGQPGIHKLWMVFEDGSVCGGLAKTYANLREVFGKPAAVIGQPGHAATLTYRVNDEGKGLWGIHNDISAFPESEKSERFPLGWGSQSWKSYYNVSYILLGQHALNDYETFVKATYYNLLADVYEANPEQKIEIYNKALEIQDYNLDSLEGLINTYKRLSNKTSQDYLEISKRVANALTYFPLPFFDVMKLIEPMITDDTDKVVFDMLKNSTLKKATLATELESLQPIDCVAVANYLLGQNQFKLATFSFDGENAGKIMIDEGYANSSIRWEYSLDGWQTKKETNAKELTLTEAELQQINENDNIQISLVGTSEIYTIDITKHETPSNLYVNDLENQFRGLTAPLEYSEDGGNTWNLYDEENTRFTEDKIVQVRYIASGTKNKSEVSQYTFKADNQPDTRKYIPLKNLKLHSYSSQQNHEDAAAINMIDGNENTGWHNTWDGEENKYYSVEFDVARYITSIEYKPGWSNGKLKDVHIYTSIDGVNWEKSGEAYNLADDETIKTLNLDQPTATKYIKLQAISTHGNPANVFFTGRMLNFFEDTTKESAVEVNITYSTETLTNQDVIATIELPEGYTVVGDKTHTFTENGTHTFTYHSPTGKEFTHTITVDWIDKVAPTATIKYNTENKTNQNVVATLNIQEENVTVVNNEGKLSYEFTKNGEFTFIISDQAGNQTEVKAEVAWINKEKPVLDVVYSTEEKTDQPVIATLVMDGAQVKSVNGKVITVTNNDGNNEYIFTENGEFTFEYVDDYGNRGTTTAKVDWIVKSPDIKVTYSESHLTNQDVIATIELSEGYTVVGDKTHIFTENGTHTFTYHSPTGKEFTHTITVDWIDKVAPTATIEYNTENKTNQNVVATLNIQEENVTVVNNEGKLSYEFTKNGEFTFIISDQAGNQTEVKAEVTWINKEKPVLDVVYSTEEKTNQPVIATLVMDGAQVKSVDGKVITVTNNDGNNEYIFTENGEFTFEYVDDYGNRGTTTAKVDWIVKTPDTPSYIIPEPIKPLIDLSIVSITEGKGTEDEPLALSVLDSAEVNTLKSMFESFDRYILTIELKGQQTRQSTLTYLVTLKNEQEEYYFTLTVAQSKNEIINYLDSLIEDIATETPDNGAETETPDNGAETETPDNGAETETPDNGAETETPDNGAETETPDNGAETETPDNGAETETPDNGAETETPDNGAETETPDNGAETETPDNGAETETPDNGAETETPDNGAETETPDNGAETETPDNNADKTHQGSKPQTGVNMKLPVMFGGIMTAVSGMIGIYKKRRNLE